MTKKIKNGFDVWENNFYNAKKFFESKGNIKTKSALKDKWFKEFKSNMEELFKKKFTNL